MTRMCIKYDCPNESFCGSAYCENHRDYFSTHSDPGPRDSILCAIEDTKKRDPLGKKHPNRGKLVCYCKDCDFPIRENDPEDEFGNGIHECWQDGDDLVEVE